MNIDTGRQPVSNKHAPSALFNVSGLFVSTPLIIKMIEIVKSKFNYPIPIKSIHGSPQCLWNGGRLIRRNYGFRKNEKSIIREFTVLTQHNIKPYMTFSNHLLTEEDLGDDECNIYLSILNNFNGGVILTSDILESYIRSKYPQISVHLSVIKSSMTSQNDRLKMYLENENKYELQTIHPDDNFDFNILKKLNPNKTEILLNEKCFYGCSKRIDHYSSIIKEQSCEIKQIPLQQSFSHECEAVPKLRTSFSKNRNISLTYSEMNEIYKLGFRNYKIQGRDANLYLYFYDLIRYTLNNENVEPVVFSLLSTFIEKFSNGQKYGF